MRWIGVIGIVALAWLRASEASACVRDIPPPFQIDSDRQVVDSTAPGRFTGTSARVTRSSGTHCVGSQCTESSCGNTAEISVSFVPPTDDQDLRGDLGYRVVWLSGSMPASLQSALERVHSIGNNEWIALELSYDDITQLDGEIALVTVDRAGNESEPSDPIHVEFDGCTHYFDTGECLETDSNCSVSAPGASHAAGWGWLVLGLGVIAGVRRARRR